MRVVSVLRKISDIIAFAVEIVSDVMLVIISLSIFVNVVGRYVFSFTFPWVEEISRYLIIWVSILITSTLIKNDELIKVDFFDVFWPAKLIKYRAYVYRALMFVLFYVLLVHGWQMTLDGLHVNIFSLKLSWFWPYLALPVGFGLMLIQLTLVTLIDFISLFKSED